ncbi:putative integral membrane protein [Salmonella enterica subsp. arizonae]|uniref:Putative integral membrane protein n=1 Tax=Salmonella enterica subsp. arizonae TaxID=59203 RepID=A0A379T7C9_SALER|nr:putative integral membrane protein [Salmonella enterica subsp. arizonae]
MEKYLRNGPMFVVLAFILWGLTPLYYQYLSGGESRTNIDIPGFLVDSIITGGKVVIQATNAVP